MDTLTLSLMGHVFNERVLKAGTTRALQGIDQSILRHKNYITKL